MAGAKYVAFGVGLLFVASSLLKLLHLPDLEVSQFMAQQFQKYAEVFPFKYIGLSIGADLYRTAVGAAELGSGVVLMYGRDPWRNWAAFKLLVIMVGAAYTNVVIGEYNVIIVNIVLGSLLLYFITNKS